MWSSSSSSPSSSSGNAMRQQESASPGPTMTEWEGVAAHLEDLQRQGDAQSIDAFGPKGTAAIVDGWAKRATWSGKTPYQQFPISILALRQVDPATGRVGIAPGFSVNHVWQQVASSLNVSIEEKQASVFAAKLARPDGVERVVFLDVRMPFDAKQSRYLMQWRAVVIEVPTPTQGFKLLKTTEWTQFARFFEAVLVTRGARPAHPARSDEAHLLLVIADTPPRHFVLRIDNTDVPTLTELPSATTAPSKPSTAPAAR